MSVRPLRAVRWRVVTVWLITLICCGRDDGTWWMPTWAEADKFREDYCKAEGHDRAAIIVGEFDDPVLV